jgi:uncharacterized protein
MTDMRWLVLPGLLALILIYAAGLRALHRHTIYPFAPAAPFQAPGFAEVRLPVAGAGDLTAYLHMGDGPAAPVVLFFMGNTGDLSGHAGFLEPHLAAGRSVIGMGYRGGGGLSGSPSEARLKADALALFDAVDALIGPGHGPVLVHGYSLGTGLALHVAARRPVDGVILDAPFGRVCELFLKSTGLTACWLPFFQKWDSLADAPLIRAPVLIRHGDQDTAVPIRIARNLAEALRTNGTMVQFDALPGVTHVTITSDPDYGPGMARFIDALPMP